jgi:hypothetical protein
VLDQPTWADRHIERLHNVQRHGTDKQWLVDSLDRYEMADRRIGKEGTFQK